MTKKMYTNKPIIDDKEPEVQLAHPWDRDHERIRQLESKVTQLANQVNRLAEALGATNRGIRRQNTNINNITTAVRNQQKY